MELFAIIFGAVLLAASVGFSLFKLIPMCLTVKKGITEQNQKKDIISLAIGTICSGIAGISLFLGLLYNNKDIAEHGIEAVHLVLIIFGALIFFPSFLWFVWTLTLKHFKTDMEDPIKKWVRHTNVITVFSSIVFFLIMMEGLGFYLTYPLPNSITFGGENGILGYPDEGKSGFSIAFYAICILSGAILVYFICDHRFYKIYGKHGMLESLFLVAFPSGLIGARLWYCYVLEFDKYSKWTGEWNAPNNPFAVWDGGLAIMGGALLGIIVGVAWVVFVKKQIKIRQAVDIIVPTILIAQAVGRWGNFFNIEVYGSAMMTMSEGFWIPSFVKYNMVAIVDSGFTPYKDLTHSTVYNLPLFWVEFITNLAGYYFIRYLFEAKLFLKGIAKLSNKIAVKTKHGALSEKTMHTIENAFPIGGCAGLYLIWYGFTRLFLEPLRSGQFEYQASSDSSVLLICLGAGLIALFAIYQYLIEPKHPLYPSRRKKYEALEAAAANGESVEVDTKDEETSKNAAEPEQKPKVEKKKEKKVSSLNDDL